jgi:hypothetical protein
MTDGSAIGFRKNPCITAPAVASAKPTAAPSAMRGRRSFVTMTVCDCSMPNENGWVQPGVGHGENETTGTATSLRMAFATVSAGMETGPMVALATTVAASATTSPPDHATVRRRSYMVPVRKPVWSR